jgi:WS/DGAT/MGAT family acyltransferase
LTDLVLSGLDAFFLYAESEAMHLHVVLTAILDPRGASAPLDRGRLEALVAERLHLVPPFRWRLAEAPLRLHHPSWVMAEDVELGYHIRTATLAAPGGPEDLGRMCGAIASLPLDRRRPLWELWLIDGLHDGNLALVAKIHHACIDGVSGAEMMTAFFDLDPEATIPVVDPATADTGLDAGPAPTEIEALATAVRARTDALRRVVPLARRTAEGLAGVRRRRAQRAEAGGTPLTAPRLSFNRPLTPERNCAFAHVPLSGVKAIKDATRCTVNDVVLALCAGALRRYLAERDELPEAPLVATCPVSIRSDEERGQHNNRVSILQTRLHTQIADPLERLHAVRRSTNAGKAEHLILGPAVLAEWSDVVDPAVLRMGARLYLRSGASAHHAPMHNVLVSNVPGPPLPVYLGGAQLVRAYPMGPVIEGAGLNITVMSYLDSIDIGFMVCDDAMPDVWELADAIGPAYEELASAVLPAVAAI